MVELCKKFVFQMVIKNIHSCVKTFVLYHPEYRLEKKKVKPSQFTLISEFTIRKRKVYK